MLSFRSLHAIQTLRPFVVHPRYQRAAGAFARPPRFRRPVHSSRGGWHTGRMAGMPSPPPREFRSSVAASVRWLRIPSISTSLPSPLSPHLSSPLSCQTTELVSKPHLFSSCPLIGRPTRRPKRPNIFLYALPHRPTSGKCPATGPSEISISSVLIQHATLEISSWHQTTRELRTTRETRIRGRE